MNLKKYEGSWLRGLCMKTSGRNWYNYLTVRHTTNVWRISTSLNGTSLNSTCHITVQAQNSTCHQTYSSQKNHHKTYCLQNGTSKNPVLPSRSVFHDLPVSYCLSRSGCPVLAVLFWLSCSFYLPWLSYPSSPLLVCAGSPVLAVLSWPPCPFWLSISACPVLPVLLCLSCSACPALTVLSCLSCPDYPVRSVQLWSLVKKCVTKVQRKSLITVKKNQKMLKKP